MSDLLDPPKPEAESAPAEAAIETAAEAQPHQFSLQSLLRGLVKHKASDLHVKVGRPPLYRINGKLTSTKLLAMDAEAVKRLVYGTMTAKQIVQFERDLQIDFGYAVPGLARFRANVFLQKGSVALVVRTVPFDVPVLENLGLPAVVQELANIPRGLVLVTGSTGSGKSTTLAGMVDFVNRNARSHILTIEDPIEYLHEDKQGTITQREMGVDATSMSLALRAALRQDPDVIMVGEMRDFETMQTALTAAETGHLVLSTLHTNTAAQSIDRILDSFPAEAKNQVRMQLASSLMGVITQRLIRKPDGSGMLIACEILTKSPTVERLIWENRLDELEATMEGSSHYYKMQTMNQALVELVRSGAISMEDALENSDRQEDLRLKLSGMVGGGQKGVDANTLLKQATNTSKQPLGDESDVVLNESGVSLEVDRSSRSKSGLIKKTG